MSSQDAFTVRISARVNRKMTDEDMQRALDHPEAVILSGRVQLLRTENGFLVRPTIKAHKMPADKVVVIRFQIRLAFSMRASKPLNFSVDTHAVSTTA